MRTRTCIASIDPDSSICREEPAHARSMGDQRSTKYYVGSGLLLATNMWSDSREPAESLEQLHRPSGRLSRWRSPGYPLYSTALAGERGPQQGVPDESGEHDSAADGRVVGFSPPRRHLRYIWLVNGCLAPSPGGRPSSFPPSARRERCRMTQNAARLPSTGHRSRFEDEGRAP